MIEFEKVLKDSQLNLPRRYITDNQKAIILKYFSSVKAHLDIIDDCCTITLYLNSSGLRFECSYGTCSNMTHYYLFKKLIDSSLKNKLK